VFGNTTVDVRENDDVGAPSTRVYEHALRLANALEDRTDVGLEGRIANVVAVAEVECWRIGCCSALRSRGH
jgi:hypothetical protein